MMSDMFFIIGISAIISTFMVMLGAITWSVFEETRLGMWIVDGIIRKREDKDDEAD